jgi:uncharacterized protein YciI
VLFLTYHRDRRGSGALRRALLEEHWAYMDRFAGAMVARGPTFEGEGEGEVLTGSVHVVDLPDAAAARAFAFEEPTYQAGGYRDVLLRRWVNVLGRTMWECPGLREDAQRWFVLGLAAGEPPPYELPDDRDELIALGPMLSDDGDTWLGSAALVQAPDPETARGVLPRADHAVVEVHRWELGGRR